MASPSEVEWAEITLEDALAELAAYRALFGTVIASHEWWQPGPYMGAPETHYSLGSADNAHDHLEQWAQKESRGTCRRCKFEAARAKAVEVLHAE